MCYFVACCISHGSSRRPGIWGLNKENFGYPVLITAQIVSSIHYLKPVTLRFTMTGGLERERSEFPHQLYELIDERESRSLNITWYINKVTLLQALNVVEADGCM